MTTMNAPAGPPICTRDPPRAEIRKPAMIAVKMPASVLTLLAIANAMQAAAPPRPRSLRLSGRGRIFRCRNVANHRTAAGGSGNSGRGNSGVSCMAYRLLLACILCACRKRFPSTLSSIEACSRHDAQFSLNFLRHPCQKKRRERQETAAAPGGAMRCKACGKASVTKQTLHDSRRVFQRVGMRVFELRREFETVGGIQIQQP